MPETSEETKAEVKQIHEAMKYQAIGNLGASIAGIGTILTILGCLFLVVLALLILL